MPDSLESALIIQLAGTLQWSAAIPPLNHFTGTLTTVDPGLPLDITQYARRDREFQHRDMVAAAAVAKVSIFARTVWNGTVVQPVLPGVTQVADPSGTNVTMPLDPSQVGSTQPNNSTAVQYVLNANVPYATIQVTDVNLYNRDLMLFETLARAATIFPGTPPITQVDPSGLYVGSTSAWATAQGTNRPQVPNAAEPLNQATFKDPDLYLAERDNQVAAYVSRVVQALKNPFDYATRIYVQIDSSIGSDTQETETYVLTDNVFVSGNTYTAGEQVLHSGNWYQAIVTTTDTPPSANWTALAAPTQLQFIGDPSLDSRNRIIYDRVAKTIQWFRETLDLIHIPQIVGFLVPGILPGQQIETVAAVPERKDAQFYRQKASRVQFSTGTWATQQVFDPTGNKDPSSTYVTGGLDTLFHDTKHVTLPVPDSFTVNFQNILCSSGTYALNCLVRPSPTIEIAGGDNDQGSVDTADGGTTYGAIGDVRNWQVALPAGGWKLFVEFSNFSTTPTSFFGIKGSQGATSILANTLPLYYTDSIGNPLSQFTVISSPGIDIQSTGQSYNFAIQWTSGAGSFHVTKLRFQQVNGPDTSHYIMQAAWIGAQGTNPAAGTNINSLPSLDVFGQANMADVMPFQFYLAGTDSTPQITVSWLPNSASTWQAISYNPGDQVLFNLIYWQASAITAPSDVPGQSSVWFQLGLEPQIPLLFEQIELSKFVVTTPTPETVGFQSFRQDMLERALRADQDAYSLALAQVGTIFPEFRETGDAWTFRSTGSWMSFLEVYAPRLRQAGTIASGDIVQGRQYEVITQAGESAVYNGQTYSDGEKFFGVAGETTFTVTGEPEINQVGAYKLSRPEDLGKTGLVPAGIEYIRTAGTGTVHGWYPSYASYPTHQAIQPWMIEQGFYVADNDFQSSDGNPQPAGALDNAPVPHPPSPPVSTCVPPPFAPVYVGATPEVSFPGQAGWSINVFADNPGGPTPLVSILDSSHVLLIDGASSPYGINVIQFTLPSTQTYFIDDSGGVNMAIAYGQLDAVVTNGVFPVRLAYSASGKRIFVADQIGKTVDVVDPVTATNLGTITLSDANAGRIWDVVYGSGQDKIYAMYDLLVGLDLKVQELDPTTGAELGSPYVVYAQISGSTGDFARMAYDPFNDRLAVENSGATDTANPNYSIVSCASRSIINSGQIAGGDLDGVCYVASTNEYWFSQRGSEQLQIVNASGFALSTPGVQLKDNIYYIAEIDRVVGHRTSTFPSTVSAYTPSDRSFVDLLLDGGNVLFNLSNAIFDPCNNQLRVSEFASGIFCYDKDTLALVNHLLVDEFGSGALYNDIVVYSTVTSKTWSTVNVKFYTSSGNNYIVSLP